MRFLSFLITLIFMHPCWAMLTDGVHSADDYLAIPKANAAYKAACGVYDRVRNMSQSGILVKKNLVATAAHGVARMVSKETLKLDAQFITAKVVGVFIAFSETETYEVEEIIIDRRYLEGDVLEQNKYDIAFLKLKNNVPHIEPATIPHDFYIPPEFGNLTVITYGTSDLSEHRIIRRGFHLYELSDFFVGESLQESKTTFASVSYSSLFFDPKEAIRKVDINDDPNFQRLQDALARWQKHKGPTALGLPGTSGSPVFITVCRDNKLQTILLGLVTSFSQVGGAPNARRGEKEHEILLDDPKKARNKYQTNFSLFYRQSFLIEDFAKGKHLEVDKHTHSILEKFEK